MKGKQVFEEIMFYIKFKEINWNFKTVVPFLSIVVCFVKNSGIDSSAI